MMIYSGDEDSVVPYNGTLKSIEKMGLNIAQDW